jgi:L-iditol 2-dehydrogenase
MRSNLQLARSGSRIGLIGMGHPIQTLPISEAALREVDLIGVFRYANQYEQAIELISQGKVDVDALITARYSLERAKEAFEALRGGRQLKIMVTN